MSNSIDTEKSSHGDESHNPFSDIHAAPSSPSSYFDHEANYPIPRPRSHLDRLKRHLLLEVDPGHATLPMAAYCFISGYLDAVTFSTVFVWCAFQTGNTVQLSLALARQLPTTSLVPSILLSSSSSFRTSDKHALTALLTFLLGATLIHILDRLPASSKSRLYLSFGTLLQALLTFAAALSFSCGAGPEWTGASGYIGLGLICASMGLQGIMAKRVNTHFATTIVLTSAWCDLAADPSIHHFRRIIPRDHKLIAAGSLFLGGFLGRVIYDQIGDAGTVAVAGVFRLLIAFGWTFVPTKME